MVPAAIRASVRLRAENRCEYCRIHQDDDPFFRFHVEHIIPIKHAGPSDDSNLALACHHCNLHKGSNLSGIDPMTGQIVPLFHPRRQHWQEHFELIGKRVIGLTPTGRATVVVMVMNAIVRIDLRTRA
jgi:5-methylcytosine-specific restriction endonuclease McrA